MNPFANIIGNVVTKLSNTFINADKLIEGKTGKGLIDRMSEASEKEEALKNKNMLLWVAKKIAIGTFKGLIGVSYHKD